MTMASGLRRQYIPVGNAILVHHSQLVGVLEPLPTAAIDHLAIKRGTVAQDIHRQRLAKAQRHHERDENGTSRAAKASAAASAWPPPAHARLHRMPPPAVDSYVCAHLLDAFIRTDLASARLHAVLLPALVEMTRAEQLLCGVAALLMIATGLTPTLIGCAMAVPMVMRHVVAARKLGPGLG